MKMNIVCIPGDGIGPEIVAQARAVLDSVADIYGHEITYQDVLMGGASIDVHGIPLTDEAIADARAADAVLMGSIGGDTTKSPWYQLPPDKRPEAGLLKIRKALNLFANLRPAVLYEELAGACPLCSEVRQGGFDMLIMRELTGGLYFGERKTYTENGMRHAVDTLTYSEEEIRRIAIKGFEIARKRRKKVTSVDKANVLDSSRLWRAVVNEVAGEYPDVVIACFGGGSNFGGLAFPFMRHVIAGEEGKKHTRFVAAEPASCPKLTRGEFRYDFGDEAGYTPLLPMYTLGHNFAPANIHAGGLRYHGAGVIVSQLLKDKMMEAVDIDQLESFEAGCIFAKAEGIIPAPESCHAIAATIREAKKCAETGEEKVILFNLSGHGLIDMASYDKYLAGDLQNYSLDDKILADNLASIEPLQP